MTIYEKFREISVVPVVVLSDSKDAKPLAKALVDGGLPCAEVTFRTEAAKESIRLMKEEYPDMLVGAGTVLTTAMVDEAIEAGAEFIVTPGLNEDVVKYCIEKSIPVTPGCMDTYAIEKAMSLGLSTIKFFPAEAAGGVKMIKALSGPYRNLLFMPTGGINEKNIADYLELPQVIACGGSWMVPSKKIDAGEFDEITSIVKEAVETVKKVRG